MLKLEISQSQATKFALFRVGGFSWNKLKSFSGTLIISFLGLTGSTISFADSTAAAAGGNLLVLQHIAAGVDQLSSQLVAMQGASQQNWQNYFNIEANMKFSAEDYPRWQTMQADFSALQGQFGSSTVDTLLAQSSQHLFNSGLEKYSTNVDQISLSVAAGAINQVNQINQSESALSDAASTSLSGPWQQEISSANQLQVLKAISAQLSVNNALMYNLWQQSQTQQLLLSRLLVQLTQLNQTVNQLNSVAISVKQK